MATQRARAQQALATQTETTGAAGSDTPQDWRDAPSRNARGKMIREALFKAAAEVVGEHGYQEASISMITQRAGVAQGTFYNHFDSRQDILDQLLPALGREMMDHIAACFKKGNTALEKEEAGFKGFFSFLKQNPHFFRILNEAESFAPNAYRTHMEHVMTGYQKFLEGARDRKEIASFDERELQVVVLVLMAARSYIAWRFVKEDGKTEEIPDWVVKAYRKLITGGVFSS